MSKTFFGQPRQLSTLFHIELWERFSFYGMNSILAMYLYHSVTKGGLGFSEAVGGSIATAYGGSVYLSTIFGGWVADRILGAERTLFYSGVLVMLGHIALALIPGVSGMIAGLVCIALGSGGVKSSASTMVGSLYENDEWRARRDAGFSIFYIAINIGGMLGPLLTGILQENIGFHYGFGLAAIGMAFGLWRYNHGRKELPKLTAPNPLPANQRSAAAVVILGVVLALIAAVHFDKINTDNYQSILLITIIVATLGYFARLLLDPRVDSDHRRYIIAYIPLFATVSVFAAEYSQFYSIVTIYFDQIMDRTIGSFTIPTGWKDSLQSLWVILFAGVTATLWTRLGDKQPKTPLKFALAMFILGSGYLFFVPFVRSGVVMGLVTFAFAILIITFGELLLSPISTSFATKIAPPHFRTQMIALNFLAFSLGFTLGSIIFRANYGVHFADPVVIDPAAALAHAAQQPWHDYLQMVNTADFFALIGGLGIAAGVVLMLLVPLLNRLLKGID
ncbi:oligopeptide:H+ symporter [uncultured Cardiobacterium sp.]|uniref:peptide MFS transporter n=1 Tax=uncultured Cardiobacterium sp. TaxID=417619 RepID=UPI002615582F|nr:oligopeptide:H+ symporter [uncultured Cardiobacterium sp.]